MKPRTLFAVRAVVSIALITILLYMVRDSIPKMIGAVKGLSVSVFLLGLMLFFVSVFVVSVRLRVLLGTQNILMGVFDLTKLTFIGYFFSSFLPTTVGGDVVKAFYISKASNNAMRSYASVFIDRFIGLFAMFLIATGALFFSRELTGIQLKRLMPLLLLACALFLAFFFNRKLAKIFTSFLMPLTPVKVKEKFRDIYNTMHNFGRHRLTIAICILVSIGAQIAGFLATYVFALGLNSYIPLKFVLLSMAVASAAGMLPAIYGTGPREMSIVIMLSPFVGKDKALAIALLWFGVLFSTALIGGIIYVFTKQYKVVAGEVPIISEK